MTGVRDNTNNLNNLPGKRKVTAAQESNFQKRGQIPRKDVRSRVKNPPRPPRPDTNKAPAPAEDEPTNANANFVNYLTNSVRKTSIYKNLNRINSRALSMRQFVLAFFYYNLGSFAKQIEYTNNSTNTNTTVAANAAAAKTSTSDACQQANITLDNSRDITSRKLLKELSKISNQIELRSKQVASNEKSCSQANAVASNKVVNKPPMKKRDEPKTGQKTDSKSTNVVEVAIQATVVTSENENSVAKNDKVSHLNSIHTRWVNLVTKNQASSQSQEKSVQAQLDTASVSHYYSKDFENEADSDEGNFYFNNRNYQSANSDMIKLDSASSLSFDLTLSSRESTNGNSEQTSQKSSTRSASGSSFSSMSSELLDPTMADTYMCYQPASVYYQLNYMLYDIPEEKDEDLSADNENAKNKLASSSNEEELKI